jgi:hypothetical protein
MAAPAFPPRFAFQAGWAALAAMLIVDSAVVARAAEVVVDVASGRQFRGELDPSSSAQDLVLRTGGNGITVRRPIRWERVVRATMDSREVSIPELQRLAAAMAKPEGATVFQPRRPLIHPQPEPVPGPRVMDTAVRSLAFDARIANWDGDVEADGLLVDVVPLAADGYLVAAAGTVEVELFASQRREFHHAPLAGGDTLERVERWTRRIESQDFTSGGVRLKLPFGAVHPEFDQKWLAHYYGLVHVRLAAPGHGVFEASQDGVRIRPYAPLRDRLELYGGRRFLPTERTGRGVSAASNEW